MNRQITARRCVVLLYARPGMLIGLMCDMAVGAYPRRERTCEANHRRPLPWMSA